MSTEACTENPPQACQQQPRGSSSSAREANLQRVKQLKVLLELLCLPQWDLKEVTLFLTQPGGLDPNLAIGLYVKAGGSEWLYRCS